jgi:hypothetical protein
MSKPRHVEFFDGKLIRMTEPGGSSEYTESSAESLAPESCGMLQWAYCPSAVIPRFVEMFRATKDTSILEESGITTASMRSRHLSMSWDRAHRVTRLVYGKQPDDFTQHDFEGFVALIPGKPELPTTRKDTMISTSGRPQVLERSYVLKIETTVPKDPELLLTFDATALDLLKYDAVSGDVTFPDGRLLYNRVHFNATVNDRSWWNRLRPWAFTSLGITLFVSGVFAYRRLRSS